MLVVVNNFSPWISVEGVRRQMPYIWKQYLQCCEWWKFNRNGL